MTPEQNLEKKGQLMKPFGLTGNIGCGKSTVATLLSKYPDVLILDCDRIAKEIIRATDTNNKSIQSWAQMSYWTKR